MLEGHYALLERSKLEQENKRLRKAVSDLENDIAEIRELSQQRLEALLEQEILLTENQELIKELQIQDAH